MDAGYALMKVGIDALDNGMMVYIHIPTLSMAVCDGGLISHIREIPVFAVDFCCIFPIDSAFD